MKRNEREVTDLRDLLQMLHSAQVCHLALNGEEYPYVVPLNYGFGIDENGVILYFHGALQGTKTDCMNRDNRVGFSIVGENYTKIEAPACSSTTFYESVCGHGKLSVVEDAEEREEALTAILCHYSKEVEFEFDKNTMEHMAILKLSVTEIHGKVNKE